MFGTHPLDIHHSTATIWLGIETAIVEVASCDFADHLSPQLSLILFLSDSSGELICMYIYIYIFKLFCEITVRCGE